MRQVAGVPRAKLESRRSQKYATVFAATADSLLREASTEQVWQILTGFMGLKFYAVGDIRVTQWFLTLFCKYDLSLLLLGGSTFLQSAVTKKTAPARISLPQTVPLTT